MSSLDRRKERGRNTRAKLGGCATQGELWKDHHFFGAPLASRVLRVSRVCVYLARSFVSCRNERPLAVQG